MNIKQIATEVHKELQKQIGVTSFEFGLTQQLSSIAPFAKANFWFNVNPRDSQHIYKECCNILVLPFDAEATGQYIYVKVNL